MEPQGIPTFVQGADGGRLKMILKGKGGISYQLSAQPFAWGGEGLIFDIVGVQDKVAKLYKQGKMAPDQERKLIKMVNDPPGDYIRKQIAWPRDVLYASGRAVGFVMDKFQLHEDLNVIYEYGSASKYPQVTWGYKIHTARNLCVVLNALHEVGYVCGDLNPKNINLNPGTGEITFVDTDSYHITDGQNVYRCNVGMPEYLPPEIQKKMQNGLSSAPLPTFCPETDNFALAVHIFQLLMNGCHPYSCMVVPSAASVGFPDTSESILKGECPFFRDIPGRKIPLYAPSTDILPDEIQKLFRLAFIDGHVSPSVRPDAETWYYALEKLEKNLVSCPDKANHEYFKNLPACPWCKVDARFSAALSGGRPMLQQSAYVPIKPPVSAVPVPPPAPAMQSGSAVQSGSVMQPGSAVQPGSVVPSVPARQRVPAAQGSSALPARRAAVSKNAVSQKTGRKTKQNRRKRIIIAGVVLLSVAAGCLGIVFYNSNEKVQAVNKMISALPNMISDYGMFSQEILDTYNRYMELEPRLQGRIENPEKLFLCMEGFNSYQTELIRQNLAEVSEDSVQNTEILADLNGLYEQLTDDQRALLTREENQRLEQLSHVHEIVQGIKDLMGDVVNNYDNIPVIKQNYVNLSNDYYRSLVYNFSQLDHVEELYQLQTALEFSEGNGGWAVSVRADAKSRLAGDVVLPSEYQGQPVKEIPEGAFRDCAGIRSITVPDSVTGIGEGAFSGCIGLQSITLPFVGAGRSGSDEQAHFGYIFGEDSYGGGLETPQDMETHFNRKYYIPAQLKEVTITDAAQLGFGAFHNCSMLTSIQLNSKIAGVGDEVFKNCSGITTVDIPNIPVISKSMFEGCSSLTGLTLSESVTRIEENAFSGCLNLVSLNSELEGDFVIGKSVQFIGEGAFSGCIRMKSVTLPFAGSGRDGSWGEGHFGYIFGSAPYSGGTQISQYYNTNYRMKYYVPSQLKEVRITDAVRLDNGAFNNCFMLELLTVNSGAQASVGDRAFDDCVTPQWE